MTGVHHVTGHTGNCKSPGIAGNDLNRCDVPVLQRKDLEQTAKEEPCSLRTVGYGWVGMGDGGRKRVTWDGNKERFVRKKGFWFVKMGKFCGQFVKFSAKERLLVCQKN